MEPVKRQWSFVIAFIITVIFTVGAQDACPDLSDEVAASDQRCTENRRCETVAQCKGNRQCVCDGPCGLRCIKTLKQDYCEEILDEPEDGQLEFDPPNTRAFNTTAIYTCNSGSILLNGDLKRVCRGDRTWSGEKPKCIDQGEACPRKEATIQSTGRECKQNCTNDGDDCSEGESCVCDDVCGLSCIPTAEENYCNQIPVMANVSTTYDRQSRKFGTIATSQCEQGYESQSGDEVRTCGGDGKWSGEDLVCVIKIICEDAPEVTNAHVEDPSASYIPGDWLFYSCNYGYYRIGLSYIRCQEDGSWNQPEIECRLMSCPMPNAPENGGREGNIFTFGSTIKMYCNTGYYMLGLPYRTCQGNQEWSGYEPACRPVECPKLYPPTNGIMWPLDEYTYLTEVEITCDRGYIPDSSSVRQCQANGEWSGQQFVCREIDCQDPGAPANGRKLGNSYGYNNIVYFQCNDGFERSGTASIRCDANEEWTAPIPQCRGFCVLPAAPNNGWYRDSSIGDRIEDGQSVEVWCYNGYTLNSAAPWTCDNGAWSFQIACVELPCMKLADSLSTTYNYDQPLQDGGTKVPSQTIATIDCVDGYQLKQGVRGSLRCDRGSWRNKVSGGPCEPEPCNMLNELQHGAISYTGNPNYSTRTVRHGTSATYTCNDRYQLTRSSDTNKCKYGQWTKSQAQSCIPEPCEILQAQDGTIEYNPPLPVDAVNVPSTTLATYRCNDGYQFEVAHLGLTRCDHGIWSTQVPNCIPKPCLLLSDEAENSNIKYDPTFFSGQPSVSSGTIATHSCNEGFQGNPVTKTCRQGEWSNGDVPVCEPAPCSKFEDFQGTVIYTPQSNDTEVPHNTSAVFSRCGWGFRLNQNNRQMTCRHGKWRGEEACRPETCKSDEVNHASIVYREGGEIIEVNPPYHGVQRLFTCDDGYTLLGNSSSTCLVGIWNNVPPVCRENSCIPITQGNHVTEIKYDREQSGNFYSVGTRATITCDENSYLIDQGDGISQCSAGAWQPSIPVCKSGNLAMGKNTIQSSTAARSPAERAVDGITTTTSDGNSCTHTVNTYEPWWQVDLGDFYTINSINMVIFNDDICPNCKKRITGAVVRVSRVWNPENLRNYTQCGEQVTFQQANAGKPLQFDCSGASPVMGRYVSVQLVGKKQRLQLCEVEVFGSGPEIGCIVPGILNGKVDNYRPNEFVTPWTDIYFRCNEFHTRKGSHYNRCRQDGAWQNEHPTCDPYGCTIGHPSNGVLRSQSPAAHGTVINFECHQGYEKNTNEDIQCQYGRLVPKRPSCVLSSCDMPPLPDHVIVTTEGYSPNDRVPHYRYVSFGCEAGYQEERQVQVREILCYQGRWLNGDVTRMECLPIPCRDPTAIEHGTYELIEENGFHENALVLYTCDNGYTTDDGALSRCQNGQWSPSSPPTCEVDQNFVDVPEGEACPIQLLSEGRIFHGSREVYPPGVTSIAHNEVAHVACSVTDAFESTCIDGQWSIPLTSCNRQAFRPCPVPHLQVGHIYYNRYEIHPTDTPSLQHTAVVTLSCDDNSLFNSRCLDGEWDVNLQSCYKSACPRPSVSSHLKQFINNTVEIREHPGEDFPVGTYIISRCHDPGKAKLIPAKSVRRECTIRGWTNPQPRCDPVEAQILIRGQNLRQLRNNGTLVIQSNYEKLYILCQVKTRWSYPQFSAPHITRVQQITASKQGYKMKKYHLGPPQVRDSGIFTCTYNGKSISLHIQVRDVHCGDPGIPDNGFRSGNDFRLTREVTFSCPVMYTLQGPSAITCNLGGWSGETPTCRRNQCPGYNIPPNVREVAGSGFHHGAIRIFQCLEGFITDNGETQVTTTCENDGQWLHDPPQCKAVQDATSGPDPCDTTKCEAWEVCAVVNNEGQCFCARPSDCPLAGSPNDTVCGSDRREYDTYCHLRATACFFTRTITVYKSGPCPDEPTEYSDEDIQEYSLYSSSDYSESQGVIPATNDSVGQDIINTTHNPGTGRE